MGAIWSRLLSALARDTGSLSDYSVAAASVLRATDYQPGDGFAMVKAEHANEAIKGAKMREMTAFRIIGEAA